MKSLPRFRFALAGLLSLAGLAQAEPLKIAYSDWPGWVAWEIAIQKAGMKAKDVTIVNTPINETPQVLASKAVDAIGAWQPNSGQALKVLPGSKPVFTSADAPGIIYDLLYVSAESLEKNKEDWAKVVKVWYKVADYIRDEENLDDALTILSARVKISPEEYEPFLKGTYILTLDEALKRWEKGDGLGNVYGSSKVV